MEELKAEREKDNVSISNMANAILVLREQLQDKEDLDEFVKFLFNKALLIYVSTDNTEDAFRMFTILNDRGIPLTSADILKSMNIGHLSNEKEIKKYAKYWEEIEGRFGEGFDRFLNFVRTIIVKEKARSNLLDEFEEKIYKLGKLKKGHDTLEFIKQYEEVYQNVIELEDTELSNQFKNLITIMKIGLRSEDWIPPLMFYYAKFKHHKLDEFLRKLEFKFVGDWVVGVNPTPRLEAMNAILKALEKANNPEELFANKDIFAIDIDEFKRNISGNIYKKQYAKYLLLKIEYLKSDNTVHLSGYKNISVEHILPQNPDPNSKWAKDFTEEEHKYWVDKIANLVLINKRKNSSLSNLDFIEKKKRYLSGRIDVFHANKVFIDQKNEWTPKVLQEREDEIVQMLIKN
nr:HNH endonuclease family protein [Bacillus methanolicus]